MTGAGARPDTSAQLVRALSALKEMRLRLESLEASRVEPIAIIGMGCRLPGASNPDELWQLLRRGGDAVTDTPVDRWDTSALYDEAPDAAGKVATRWGGFLESIDRFDAAFFGISPREAAQMDPQQRLLLEVAWEALEDGGLQVDRLAGTDTGVFVGVHSHSEDYFLLQAADPAGIDLYSGTGTSHSVASGRLSYVFDFRGPSLAVDTACSSSLVAVHLAVQSLRSRECSAAIAGGVNVMLDPSFTMVASRMRMMSPTGRCRPFDASGDGFVRAEGCAVVVLKRWSDAVRDGDRVLALIKGSAVNQDGRTNGLTAPNSLSQQAVIRAALANAGVRADEIDVVETHGTGTPLGDPIEAEALADVFALGARADGHRVAPVLLGSLKANIGHTEGAAGVASLVKTVLQLRAAEVAPMVHFEALNPHITLAGTPLVVPTVVAPWPAGAGPRSAGVSSFGWSGTNAHVVVSEAPHLDDGHEVAHGRTPGLILPISARSETALRALATSYRERLAAAAETDLAAVCAAAARRRTHHDHRACVTGQTRADLLEALDAYLAGHEHRGVHYGVDPRADSSAVFVFSGQGGQWPGMAADLLATDVVFRTTVERCAAAIGAYVDWSVLDVLSDTSGARLDEVDVVQPVLFAVQVGLAAVMSELGITPDAVVGHSMGEVAAAHVAGVLTLDDAARVICARSTLLRTISGTGAMAVVELDALRAAEVIAGVGDRLSIAAVNGPSSTVLSGDRSTLDEVLAILKRDGVFCRRVNVDVASHSPQVEPLLGELRRLLEPVRPAGGTVPFMSTVTASHEAGASLDAEYWVRNLRDPVRLSDAVRSLAARGDVRFIELSPHPVLATSLDEAASGSRTSGRALACMRRGEDGQLGVLSLVASLYCSGRRIEWRRVLPHLPAGELPRYPWQRERFWLEPSSRSWTNRAGDPVADMIHPVVWREASPAQLEGSSVPTDWLVIDDGSDLAMALVDAFRATGRAAALIGRAEVDLAGCLGSTSGGQVGIVFVGASVPAESAGAQAIVHAQVEAVTSLLETATRVDVLRSDATLWVTTVDTWPIDPTDRAAGHAHGALWGAGRAIADEMPSIWGGCIDADPHAPAAVQAGEIVHEITHRSGNGDEGEVALRHGTRFVPRLVTSHLVPERPLSLTGGAVLVSGGFGAVGRDVARWAVRQGASHVVLLGRTDLGARSTWDTLDPASIAGRHVSFVRELEAHGAVVRPGAVDVGDETALRSFLHELQGEDWPVIRSVFHAAAEFGGDLVSSTSRPEVHRQLVAKAVGALTLGAVLDPDHFVLFSSIGALMPVPGQAVYAAANGFLDAFARYRIAAGRPALSINWGVWRSGDDGEGRALQVKADALNRSRGIHGFEAVDGLEAMRLLMRSGVEQAVVARMDWDTLRRSGEGALAGLLHDRMPMHRSTASTPSTDDPDAGSIRTRVLSTDEAQRHEVAEGEVRRVLGGVLRMSAAQIDGDVPFGSLGMDSLTAVELRNHLQEELGVKLSATLAWNHPTVRELAAHVVSTLTVHHGGESADPVHGADPSPTAASGSAAVAKVSQLSDDEALAALMDGGFA